MNLGFVLVLIGTILAGVSYAERRLLPPGVVLIGLGVMAGVAR